MIHGVYTLATCKLQAYDMWAILFKLLGNDRIFFMMMSGTTLTITLSLVISLSTMTA